MNEQKDKLTLKEVKIDLEVLEKDLNNIMDDFLSEYKEDFKRFSSEAAASTYKFRLEVKWAGQKSSEMCKINEFSWYKLKPDASIDIKVTFHINQPFTVCTIR